MANKKATRNPVNRRAKKIQTSDAEREKVRKVIPLSLAPDTILQEMESAKITKLADPNSVSERLADLGNLFRRRNVLYGDDYRRAGEIMVLLFPHGVELETARDHNRMAAIKMMATKLNRYCANYHEGGHADSLDDLAVYAQILRHLDALPEES